MATLRGLGDLVDRIAKPIAKAIDEATADFGARYATNLAGCSACSKRRRFLNLVVPDVRAWRNWLAAPGRLRLAWKLTYQCSKRSQKPA